MSEGITGLGGHEGENLMREISFLELAHLGYSVSLKVGVIYLFIYLFFLRVQVNKTEPPGRLCPQ